MDAPSDVRIFKVFKYCKDAFKNAGINVSFPKNTDPKKTYKWRYIIKFIQKVDELGMSANIMRRLIDEVAKYASKQSRKHKGLALLVNEQVLSMCCDNMADIDKQNIAIVDRIREHHNKVRGVDLLSKTHKNGLPKIVKLYMQGEISELFLAISKKCHEAMMRLDKTERSMLPSGNELVLNRMELDGNLELKGKVKEVMEDDWRNVS